MGLGRDELREPAEVEADLDCPVCLGLLVEAVAGACGHSFCRLCIERVLDVNPRCPVCRHGVSAAALSACHLVDLRVNALTVCCERRCGWYGRRDERPRHAKECEVAKATEFTALMSGKLGLSLEMADGVNLVVAALEEGAVQKYNAEAAQRPGKQVVAGCAVVEVNGIRGDANELAYVIQRAGQRGSCNRLVFRRPTEFCATIDKRSSSRLGLVIDVPCEVGVSYLLVQAVEEGAVMEHNAQNAAEEVKSYDRIVAVNGCHGRPTELLVRMKSAEICTMTIQRFSP